MLPGIQEELLSIHKQHLLDRLLTDKTTKTNIIWATDAYNNLGDAYRRDKEITSDLITGHNSGVIKNRARKALEQQAERTRQHAEVFTPLWICEKMNDHIDEVWFNRKQGIHKTEPETEHILFTTNKKWTYYVDSRRLEITCGEAPYLVSRYDVSTGEAIPIEQRIGILDRKLRAVNENATTEAEWIEWAIRAFQATYGYEFQGDNVLIARVNLLMTFEEYLYDRWKRKPTEKEYQTITNIICWNIWQMDGLTGTIPYCKAEEDEPQMTFVLPGEEPAADSAVENTQPKCRIFDWRRENSIEFKILTEGDRKMKFDFIIGNPPFQDETIGENTSYAPPIFNRFMDESYYTDKSLHLLAFDLMYCCRCYNFYAGMEFTPRKAPSSKAYRLEQLREKEAQERAEKIAALDAEIRELELDIEQYEDISLVGVQVTQKDHGTGVIISQDLNFITVKFEKAELKFIIHRKYSVRPTFEDDTEIVDALSDLADKTARLKTLKEQRQKMQM